MFFPAVSSGLRKATSLAVTKRSVVTISNLHGREIIDSRGNPTVEVDMTLSCGTTFTASVPSGASTGIYEAVELRDGGTRYMGKGVRKAVNNVNTVLKSTVLGMDPADQRAIDDAMLKADGSANKGNLGANALLGGMLLMGYFLVSG
jgi:enolase